MQIPAFHREKIVDLPTLKTAIKGLLINQKLWKMALAKHYDQVPEVREAIENAENNIYLKYKRAQILAAAQVPDSTLRHYYKKEIFKFNSPPMINVREILVQNWDQALELKKRLLDGADFSALARQYSVRSWSAQKGGEIGYSELARFGKLKDKLWKAPIGQIIGPLEIKPGLYGLFRVEGKKDAAPLPFDQIKQAVLKEYKGENQTELIRAYLEQLRKKVQIKRNLPLVKSFRLAEDPN
jgi:parvulin-like peptidyl-prolyl isomerase